MKSKYYLMLEQIGISQITWENLHYIGLLIMVTKMWSNDYVMQEQTLISQILRDPELRRLERPYRCGQTTRHWSRSKRLFWKETFVNVESPLHDSAKHGHRCVIKMLVGRGAYPNTGLPAYSDSVGTAKKCHCKQGASYCVTVTGVQVGSPVKQIDTEKLHYTGPLGGGTPMLLNYFWRHTQIQTRQIHVTLDTRQPLSR